VSLKLQAKAIKVSIVLDAAALVGVVVPNGQPRFPIIIGVAGRTLKAELNAKSARKCCATIAEHGPDGVAVLLQGKLAGDVIEDAGIAATPRTTRPPVEPETVLPALPTPAYDSVADAEAAVESRVTAFSQAAKGGPESKQAPRQC
jgi:hypothetical protein